MSYPLAREKEIDFAAARTNMVNGQLATNGIVLPPLVAAYRETPREIFLPDTLMASAYLDEDVIIPHSKRFVLEPLVEARMIQHALLTGPCDTALVLGAASLPTVEMVAAFARHVTVVEPDKYFAGLAETLLKRQNVTIIETSYREGYAKQSPYDVIFLTGAMAMGKTALATQLSKGGRLMFVSRRNEVAAGVVSCTLRLSDDEFETISLAGASTPYLQGFEPEKGFQF